MVWGLNRVKYAGILRTCGKAADLLIKVKAHVNMDCKKFDGNWQDCL
jgi:hypothetical protein